MTAVAVDILAVLFALVCLHGAKPAKPLLHTIHPDYLSTQEGKCLRGVLSVVIVLHHLAQKNMGLVLFPVFAKIGYLATSVFFFLSGYGLMTQYMHRENYSRCFLRRRFPAVFVPYLLAILLCWAVYPLLGTPWTFRDILQGFREGTPIVTGSWYIICILLFYIAFRLLMWLCGKRYLLMLPGGLVFCGVYIFFCRRMGYGSWWYNTVPILVMGMAWALFQEKIDGFFTRHSAVAVPGLFFVFLLTYGGKILLNPYIISDGLHIALTWITTALFDCCVLILLMQVRLDSPVLRLLGEVSMETYLCHYLCLMLLRSPVVYIQNDCLFILAVLVISVGMAWVFHRVNGAILRPYYRWLSR